jgi:hypothetical protein
VSPDIGALLREVAHSSQFAILLYLWAADFILGILSSLYPPVTFRLSKIADTLRTDGLRFFTWFILFSLGTVASESVELLGVIDLGTVANAMFVALSATFVGSILKSVGDFGVDMPEVISGADPGSDNDYPTTTTTEPMIAERGTTLR